jgi:putative transcriptional regulator
LKKSLEEGIGFARGELSLRTTLVPVRPPKMPAQKVVRLRQRLGMSQAVFAQTLNVSTKTVQSWEQGERRPSQAALRLLQILEARPQVVGEVLGNRSAAVS